MLPVGVRETPGEIVFQVALSVVPELKFKFMSYSVVENSVLVMLIRPVPFIPPLNKGWVPLNVSNLLAYSVTVISRTLSADTGKIKMETITNTPIIFCLNVFFFI
ncbi:MAG: hypothetical protein M8352_04020 [ANME-2 cluster archaeon]|nr:hypothetical protein [ANME-2 cluster archaeon]